MTREELKSAVEALRARRESIPALRDYRPQRGGKAAKEPAGPIDVGKIFGNLIKEEE